MIQSGFTTFHPQDLHVCPCVQKRFVHSFILESLEKFDKSLSLLFSSLECFCVLDFFLSSHSLSFLDLIPKECCIPIILSLEFLEMLLLFFALLLFPLEPDLNMIVALSDQFFSSVCGLCPITSALSFPIHVVDSTHSVE